MSGWLDKPLVIGIALQVGAYLVYLASARLLYSALWLGVLFISVPMFVASPFFLMRSAAPLPVRLLTSFWIVAIPAYFLTILAIEHSKVRTEVLLIPQGYRGLIAVNFDEKSGAAPEREGDKAVFRIGPDGEARTQDHEVRFSNPDPGDSREQRREYYFVDATGARTRIERVQTNADTGDRVVVFLRGDYFDKQDGVRRSEWFVGTAADQQNHYAELDRARKETFEIQKGLRGKVTILFDVADGDPVMNSGGDMTYRIGPTGVLRTQAHEARLYYPDMHRKRDVQREFYEWDGSGMSQHLKRPDPYDPAAIPKDEVIVVGFRELYGENCVSRIEFFLGTTAELEKLPGRENPPAH